MEGSDGLRRMNDFITWVMEEGDSFLLRNARFDCEAIRWLPPIPNPPLMFGIGGNSPFFFRDKPYQIPGYPQGFLRPRSRTALIGHMEIVTIPPYLRNFRSAAELGVIIEKSREVRSRKRGDGVCRWVYAGQRYVFGHLEAVRSTGD